LNPGTNRRWIFSQKQGAGIKRVESVRPNPLLVCLTLVTLMPGCTDSDHKSDIPGSIIRFTEVTAQSGLSPFVHATGAFGKKWMPETFGSGGGFIDYDNDGWLDILLCGGGGWPELGGSAAQVLWLFKNNGDGTFVERTEESGLGTVDTYTFGISCADYDNDGDEDFFLTTLTENKLFRNDGAIFSEVGRKSGVAGEAVWSTASMWLDADRDGWLDLYVGNYVDWTPENDLFCSQDGGKTKGYCTPLLYDGMTGRFYRNNGDGTFSDRTRMAGFLPASGKTLGCAETDFNYDGWPDIIVANDTERDLLYENNGDGTFTEKGLMSGIAFDEAGRAAAGMGVEAGVVDTTGRVSIFVGNFSNEMVSFYRYLGDGIFEPRSALSKIGHATLLRLTFGLVLFDVDLDTDLDLLAANGHIQPSVDDIHDGITYREQSQLFVNDGTGSFAEVGPAIGGPFADSLVCRAAAFGDIDRDGDVDVLMTENGGPVHLWRNDTKGNNFLRVRVRGVTSNRDGVGAQLTAYLCYLRMYRRVRTGGSYLTNSEKMVTFGLGKRTTLDSLSIIWPSGKRDSFENILANREIFIVEGETSFEYGPARMAE
jgi:hypothetical protein